MSFVDTLPLWLLYILFAGLVLLSIEVGWRLGDHNRRRDKRQKVAPTGAAVGATLGLLAFLLAFTFGMAANRFDTRKQNVLEEANTIGTTYLRVDFLPTESQEQARSLLRRYTALHSGGASAITSPQGMAESVSIQDQLWAIAADAEAQADTPATALFIQTLNEMIDIDETRLTALRNRIPDTIWMMLAVVTLFSMAAMGYEFGLSGGRNWTAVVLLTVAFTAVTVLIADLDRPQTGLVQVSQQPLLDLLERIGTPAP